MTTPAPTPAPADHGFEVKSRRKWPFIVGGVAVLVIAAVVITVVTVTGASKTGAAESTTLKVGFLSTDGAQQTLLEYIADEVAPDYGITVVPTGIGDPNQLSQGTNDGELAGTIYAHKPWIEQSNAAKNWKVTAVEPVFQWAYSLYSSRYGSVAQIPDGATIGILDDPANTAQALILLSGAKLITLDPAVDASKSTLKDVKTNPRHLVLKPIAFGTAARSLGDIDAIISYNFEFVAASTPAKYKIYSPDAPRIFAGQLAIGTPYLEKPAIKKLIKAFADDRVQEYLATTSDPKVKDQLTPVSK